MAIVMEEITGGEIAFKEGTEVRHFRARGATGLGGGVDAFDAVANFALANLAPTITTPVGLLFLQDIRIQEQHYGRAYYITAPYGRLQLQPGANPRGGAGAYQITVDQTGGTANCKAGRRISGYSLTAGDMVNNGGLIGVEGDEVKGTDIPVEQTKVTVMFRHPQGVLNKAYIDRIGRLVGFPNDDVFLGYKRGEVLYKGGNFSETNTEATAVYNFDISFQRTSFVVGGITVTTKEGWDVLSLIYKSQPHNNGTKTQPAKILKCIEVIRPREWVAYQTAFGWGG